MACAGMYQTVVALSADWLLPNDNRGELWLCINASTGTDLVLQLAVRDQSLVPTAISDRRCTSSDENLLHDASPRAQPNTAKPAGFPYRSTGSRPTQRPAWHRAQRAAEQRLHRRQRHRRGTWSYGPPAVRGALPPPRAWPSGAPLPCPWRAHPGQLARLLQPHR